MPSFPLPTSSRSRSLALALAIGLIVAAPAWSYIVILKGGEQITTEGPPERRGNQVVLTLPNGNQVSYPAAEIDFTKTEELNAGNRLSNARILETRDPNAGEDARNAQEDRRTLADLVGNRPVGTIALPPRSEPTETPEAGPQLPTTGAGFVDFTATKRLPYVQDEIASELMLYLRGQGHEDIRIFQGTQPNRPLVEISASSEASVFKALRDAANGLLQVGQRHASLGVLELLLVTEGGQVRAGQFTLTEEQANLLATGEVQPPTFFLRYVEF